MNPRKITVQGPFLIPQTPSVKGDFFLHVFATGSGFMTRWVDASDCPMYIRVKTGQKARLVMSMTGDIKKITQHGKIVLTFEEMLVCEGGRPLYKTWKTEEWFPFSPDAPSE